MRHRHNIQRKLARAIGRSILSIDLHPAFYFSILMISFMHTILCITNHLQALNYLVRWFDPSLFIPSAALVYVMIAPILAIALCIIIQICWAFKDHDIQTTLVRHYIIKCSTTLAYTISYALSLPIIRSSIILMNQKSSFNNAIGTVLLLAFLLIIYPYSMFLLTDLSPKNNKIFAVVFFPNCSTVMNLYRPVAAIMTATGNQHYGLIPTLLVFLFLNFAILKYPSTTWRYNKVAKGYFSCYIWTILCHFLSLQSA